MTESTGPNRGPRNATVTLAGEERTIEAVTGLKASRAFAILRAVGDKVPELAKEWGQFTSDYEANNYVELDRPNAMIRYGQDRPLERDGEPVYYPATMVNAAGDEVPHPRAGEPVTVPSSLANMSEEAWAAAGNKVRLPESPETYQKVAAVFPHALEVGEEHVYNLLALFTVPNDELKKAWKGQGIKELLERQVEDVILEAWADELLELAVVAGELVEQQFVEKARSLGGRLGNALRIVGIDPTKLARQTAEEEGQTTAESSSSSSPETPTPTPTSSPPASSTDSAPPTDGDGSTPSTPPTSSSDALVGASSASGSS